MAIGDVYRLSATWDNAGGGTEQVNVFHFRQDTDLIFDTPEEDLSQRFIDEVVPSYRALVSSFLAIQNIGVRTLGVPAFGQDFPQTGMNGLLVAATILPLQVAAIVTWRTPFIGRRYRGRTYLPTATEAESNGTAWSNAYLTAMAAFADDVLGMGTPSIDHAEWTLVVGTDLVTPKPTVTTYTVQPVQGIIRRRRPGSGS